jgi:arginyl-tRNA synthetase
MNFIGLLKEKIINTIKETFGVGDLGLKHLDLSLNIDKEESYGDLSCNAAMILAKTLGKNPKEIAEKLKKSLICDDYLKTYIKSIDIAGPGFINLHLNSNVWQKICSELLLKKNECFKTREDTGDGEKKYLIEFVSANPTGPLHLGHGRGGIIGDVLANVISFLGKDVTREFYINDAGNQILKLGKSLKIRCQQELGQKVELPEDSYQGTYLIDIAKHCIEKNGEKVIEKPESFFVDYAKIHLLNLIKSDLGDYGIFFNEWFSEKSLHEDGSVKKAIDILIEKKLAYKKDGALWFKSSEFGDDKDRVIQKKDGSLTYIAADIAYHKNKFDRGYKKLIDILGQDHHGYVKRLKATLNAIGYNQEDLDVILYQLVSIKKGDVAARMSKRSGNFATLREIIDAVGKDVARFFYLNRKAEAHLEFDLETALKKTDENPVYYAQYAYVRTNSLLQKAKEIPELKIFVENLQQGKVEEKTLTLLAVGEIKLLRKILSLGQILKSIKTTYQTHLLTYYLLEIAKQFHNYYAHNRIIDAKNLEITKCRLMLVSFVRLNFGLCLDLLGISKPEKM